MDNKTAGCSARARPTTLLILKGWTVSVLAVLMVTSARAGDATLGGGFYDHCKEAADWERTTCLAYIKGLYDMAGYLQPPSKARLVCAPHGVTLAQYLDILIKYLEDNPERRPRPTAELIWEAASESFPCPAL